jgi:DNA polymerase III epsilon subunit-like protein
MKKVNHLIKPINIKIENSHIHGITQELAEKNGIKMYEALKELEDDLKFVDTIVAHNLLFDYNIILSECYRLNFNNLINKIESLNKSCTMKLGRKVMGVGKYPKLSVLYEFLFQKEIVQEHRALSDVLFCLDCYIKMVEILNLDMNGCRKIEEKNISL